jgi:hypothetical protein
MDKNEQKDLIRFLLKQAREYHHEILALRVTGYVAEQNGFPFLATLKNARQHPDVQKRTDHFFEGFEERIGHLDEDAQEKALREFLENWKPEGEPN